MEFNQSTSQELYKDQNIISINSKDSVTIIASYKNNKNPVLNIFENEKTNNQKNNYSENKSIQNNKKTNKPNMEVSTFNMDDLFLDSQKMKNNNNSGKESKLYLTNSSDNLVSHRVYEEDDIGMVPPWNKTLIKKKSDDDDYDSDEDIIRYAIKLCMNDVNKAITKERLYEKDYINWSQDSSQMDDSLVNKNEFAEDIYFDSKDPVNLQKNTKIHPNKTELYSNQKINYGSKTNVVLDDTHKNNNSKTDIKFEKSLNLNGNNKTSQLNVNTNTFNDVINKINDKNAIEKKYFNIRNESNDIFTSRDPSSFFMFQSNLSNYNFKLQLDSTNFTRKENPVRFQTIIENHNQQNRANVNFNNIVNNSQNSTEGSENIDLSKTKKLLLRRPKNYKSDK